MYIKAVVSFIDILGFRELVGSRSHDEIQAILKLVTSYAVPETDEDELCHAVQFSDSVVRVAPVIRRDGEINPVGAVFHEFLSLVHAQAELMNKGVLIRGGISYGDVSYADRLVFGPALISAYDLESKFAQFSRIVIDPMLLDAYMNEPHLRAVHHSLRADKSYIRDLICQGDDGVWFIDYARAMRTEMDDPEQYPRFLSKQKALAIDGLRASSSFDSKLSKFFWLAKYHNSVAQHCTDAECRRAGIDPKDVRVSAVEMALANPLRIKPAY